VGHLGLGLLLATQSFLQKGFLPSLLTPLFLHEEHLLVGRLEAITICAGRFQSCKT
jgi:hypothetical protein